MNQTKARRNRGRPRKADALTTVQRSQRYRDKQCSELKQSVAAIMAQLTNEASKSYDRDDARRWQESLADQCEQVEKVFYEAMTRFETDHRNVT